MPHNHFFRLSMSEQGYTNQENRESPHITLNTYPSSPKKKHLKWEILNHIHH